LNLPEMDPLESPIREDSGSGILSVSGARTNSNDMHEQKAEEEMSFGSVTEPDREPRISEIRLRIVPNGTDGLIAFASCRYGSVLLNDIAIRREESGHLYLTYPRRLAASGRPHPLHHPIDRETADQFEEAILGQLRRLLGGADGVSKR